MARKLIRTEFTTDKWSKYKRNSKDFEHRLIWEAYTKSTIPKGYHVHHINGDKLDNRIENLELVNGKLHISEHSKKWHAENKEKSNAHLDSVRYLTKEWHSSPKGLEWHKNHVKISFDKYREQISKELWVCGQCQVQYTPRAGQTRFCSNKCKSAWRRSNKLDDEQRNCRYCKQQFLVNKYSKTRTCTRVCSQKLRRKTESL